MNNILQELKKLVATVEREEVNHRNHVLRLYNNFNILTERYDKLLKENDMLIQENAVLNCENNTMKNILITVKEVVS
jgi:regulator of replication initiation timing